MQPDRLKKNLLEIVNRLRSLNASEKSEEFIPSSDVIYRKHLSDLCNSENQCTEFLRILIEAHYIFTFNLVEADERLMISSVRGFVVADTGVITKMRERADRQLERAYEHQFYARKAATTIMREMIGDARKFNNTPFGKALNIAIMLEQYQHLLYTDINDFTETARENRLNEIIKVQSPDEELMPEAMPAPERPQRAADSPEAIQAAEMNLAGKWGEAVQKFGVEFLVRIHFRKYEFDKVIWLIKTQRITQEKDLRFVRDTIRLMEGRTTVDPRLKLHLNKMADLRRLAQVRINQLRGGGPE
ncbi:MAG: hypothetical protein HS115_01515 [Spirochaetales bacterium]|nr:hypothetical protein [Spirochaetales bacterium]